MIISGKYFRGNISRNLTKITENTGRIDQNEHDIESLRGDGEKANSGVAAAAALGTLLEPSSPGKTTVMAGVAYYEGESAAGVNVSHLVNWPNLQKNRPTVNAGISVTTADTVLGRIMVGIEF